MSTVFSDASPFTWTIADVHAWLPGFPDDRILIYPTPGTATEEDLLGAEVRTGRIYELIDGTLVQKTMATYESTLAFVLGHFILCYLDTNDIGIVAGPDGLLKILPAQIRAPDVSFIRWERLPGSDSPKPAVYPIAPDLAAEILSENNTKKEMDRKLKDYFDAGVRLVWYIDPATRTARAYVSVDDGTDIGPSDALSGGEVLPGFRLPLPDLFARADRPYRGK